MYVRTLHCVFQEIEQVDGCLTYYHVMFSKLGYLSFLKPLTLFLSVCEGRSIKVHADQKVVKPINTFEPWHVISNNVAF